MRLIKRKGKMDEKASILIVDDNESDCRSLSLIFGKKGYKVETVGTGRETLEKVQGRFFNAALLDVRLPDMEGTELLVPLKKIHPDMVIIMITAYASLETATRALNEGASAYLTKPLKMDEVLATIGNALEKQRLTIENRRLYQEVQQELIERKQAEEALREERDRAQKHLDVVGVVLVAVDANRKVTLINKKGCEILGCKEEEIIGKDWFDNFLPERTKDEVVAIFDKLMAGKIKSVEYYESPVLTGTGGEIFIAWHNTVLTDETGKIIGALSSGEDITERRLLWTKMVEYEELNKLKTNLLSTVSHELRTPLASIKGYSTMLLDYDKRLPRDEKRQHLESIDRATDRLTELIDHLLDMSRLEAGLLRLDVGLTSIEQLIQDAVAEARLRSPGYRLKVKVKGKLPALKMDVRRIRQVLDNLLDNACKYSKKGTEVLVRAQTKAHELEISVTDHGRGIPAADIDRVFDRMYRIEQRLAQDPGGLGLGLALCKALVETHRGRIWLESTEGIGTTVYFTLPLVTEEELPHDEKEP